MVETVRALPQEPKQGQHEIIVIGMLLAADDAASFLDYVSRGGVVGLLIVILYGGFRREPWWVFGWVYRDLLGRYVRRGEQLDRWWETAQKATATAQELSKERLPSDGKKNHSEEGDGSR